MSLFGLFGKNTIHDPWLGEISHGFGKWKGNAAKIFDAESVEIRIPGDKNGPSSDAINNLKKLEGCYPSMKGELAKTLFEEHYKPGKEAFDSGEFGDLIDEYPIIESPEAIWPFVGVVRVWVNSYGNKGKIEIAYETEWDIEHTLGFVFENCKVIEFCGSVGP